MGWAVDFKVDSFKLATKATYLLSHLSNANFGQTKTKQAAIKKPNKRRNRKWFPLLELKNYLSPFNSIPDVHPDFGKYKSVNFLSLVQ
jgi:hypothetical protein